MTLTLLKGLYYQGETYNKGDVVEISDEEFAKRLIEKGTATQDEGVEVKATPTAFEQAESDSETLRARAQAEHAAQTEREQAVRAAEEAKKAEQADAGGQLETAPLSEESGMQPTPQDIENTLNEAGLGGSSDADSQQ